MKSQERRKELMERMQELEGQGFGCSNCMGNCCTFEANSMMVTPLQALDILFHLHQINGLTEEFKEKCHETIKKFRLDHPNGNGKRSFIRRTYTCPFFGDKELGCPLPTGVKPYGCLAFNAHHSELKAKDHCYSEKDLLIKREQSNPEEELLNSSLQKKVGILWEKTPLPLALIDLWDVKISDVDL